jgi:DNA (cytosine-5)-methyltransferase 1
MTNPTVLEICAGAGGQSLGLEQAGFKHVAAIEIDQDACLTLARNRPSWHVVEEDVARTSGWQYRGVDLLAGGIPCPPFSIAGKQLGESDERDLFPQIIRLAGEVDPSAIMIENVRGFAAKKFDSYRRRVMDELEALGYKSQWTVLNASDFGVPQLRPRFILVALARPFWGRLRWPHPADKPPTVGATLLDLMSVHGWPGADQWARDAAGIAPTIVGGSKKHGGPDLGPTRAREQWRRLRVDGLGLANDAPDRDFPPDGTPRLTNRMVARIQGFPDDWCFAGGKTTAYRQVGNAFPPPVACAVGEAIRAALSGEGGDKQLALRAVAEVASG